MHFFNFNVAAVLLILCQNVIANSILIPLYIYPGNNAWAPLFDAIKASPTVQFNVVINPSNGPLASNALDSNWISNIKRLNTYPQVRTLGYVHVSYGARSIADVEADINTWAQYLATSIHIDGVFFDEVANHGHILSGTFNYMLQITNFARTALAGIEGGFLVFNPGQVIDPSFYAMLNEVIVFENTYAAYSPSILQTIPAANIPQSCFVIHNFPAGDTATQKKVVKQLNSAGVGGVFITTQDQYDSWGSMWTSFVAAMASVLS